MSTMSTWMFGCILFGYLHKFSLECPEGNIMHSTIISFNWRERILWVDFPFLGGKISKVSII